ncbi:MAG: hypothetical protein Q8O89_04030 [Nanoarchaeota archaeon]|nr:hypothetical protein [Nanoarchaeota archaeon]
MKTVNIKKRGITNNLLVLLFIGLLLIGAITYYAFSSFKKDKEASEICNKISNLEIKNSCLDLIRDGCEKKSNNSLADTCFLMKTLQEEKISVCEKIPFKESSSFDSRMREYCILIFAMAHSDENTCKILSTPYNKELCSAFINGECNNRSEFEHNRCINLNAFSKMEDEKCYQLNKSYERDLCLRYVSASKQESELLSLFILESDINSLPKLDSYPDAVCRETKINFENVSQKSSFCFIDETENRLKLELNVPPTEDLEGFEISLEGNELINITTIHWKDEGLMEAYLDYNLSSYGSLNTARVIAIINIKGQKIYCARTPIIQIPPPSSTYSEFLENKELKIEQCKT